MFHDENSTSVDHHPADIHRPSVGSEPTPTESEANPGNVLKAPDHPRSRQVQPITTTPAPRPPSTSTVPRRITTSTVVDVLSSNWFLVHSQTHRIQISLVNASLFVIVTSAREIRGVDLGDGAWHFCPLASLGAVVVCEEGGDFTYQEDTQDEYQHVAQRLLQAISSVGKCICQNSS